jgi:prepilin-type N-terminal cleavage/methylation domain-containing protein
MKASTLKSEDLAGFALLEVLLALALFSIVAVSMSEVLDQVSRASLSLRTESELYRKIENVLSLEAGQGSMQERESDWSEDESGVQTKLVVRRLSLHGADGRLLEHLFQIEAEARKKIGTGPMLFRKMETRVYAPKTF